MRKILTWFFGLTGVLMLAFFVLAMTMTGCFTFRKTDRKVEKLFAKANTPVRIIHDTYEGGTVRWVEVPATTPTSLLICFVHGAPGSSDAFYAYLQDSLLRQTAKMVSIDRLGFGYSHYGQPVVSIEEQARFVKYILDTYSAEEVWLVGHSYGGPIVGEVAIEYPEQVDGIVMLAPVNDPATEKIFWYSGFAKWKLTRWTMSKALRVSGDEKYAHRAQLEKMVNGWQNIDVPVVHVHGRKDDLADPANLAFSQQHISSKKLQLIELSDVGHLIPFTRFDTTRSIILQAIQPDTVSQN